MDQQSGKQDSGSHQLEDQKEKRIKKNEDSIRDLWDHIKHNNIRIIRVPDGEERGKGQKTYLKK